MTILQWLLRSVLVLGLWPSSALGYSVLTHQAHIDVCWQPTLLPLLEQRYPGATPQELLAARAHAYGGLLSRTWATTP